MSKRRKALIAAAIAVGALLVPTLAGGSGSGSARAVTRVIDITSITSNLIANNTIRSIDIMNNTINSIDILNNTITSIDIRNRSIGKVDLAPDVLTLRAYGRIENGAIVPAASSGLTGITHPFADVACVAVAGVSDASKLAPVVSQLVVGDHYGSVMIEASSPYCPRSAIALMAQTDDSFTIVVP